MLYHAVWPKVGTVRNLLQNFTRAVEKECKVIAVFDRYVEESTKATADKLGHRSLQLLAGQWTCPNRLWHRQLLLRQRQSISCISLAEIWSTVGLDVLGCQKANIHDILNAGHKFISILYKERLTHISMNHHRHSIFVSTKNTPTIKRLPHNDLALNEHIKRAHLQNMLWKAADKDEPAVVSISEFGWDVIEGVPTPRTGASQCAPPELMKFVACECSGQSACARKKCSCFSSGVSCTGFCKCMAKDSCNNPHTQAGSRWLCQWKWWCHGKW